MRTRSLLVAFLLTVVLCFVSGAGYGEIAEWMDEGKASFMEFQLLGARVNYIMRNPTNFLEVRFIYDTIGTWGEGFPKNVYTKGKIYVWVTDNRGLFSDKSGVALLDTFKKRLEVIYSFISLIATNMNTDIVAILESRERINLAYFYQGEYYLWNE